MRTKAARFGLLQGDLPSPLAGKVSIVLGSKYDVYLSLLECVL